jgi:hypothetical protein
MPDLWSKKGAIRSFRPIAGPGSVIFKTWGRDEVKVRRRRGPTRPAKGIGKKEPMNTAVMGFELAALSFEHPNY